MTTLLLADDHQLVRKAIRHMLEEESAFQVIAEAADGAETIQLVEQLKPEILLLDLSMPRIHGLDVVRYVTENTNTKVVVVSMFSSEAYVLEALKNGARGYVLKESTPGTLVTAIRQVADGQVFLSETLPQNELLSLFRGKYSPEESLACLTRKEKIVLQLAAEGYSSNEIAKLLVLSPRTIESHRSSLMRKLKLKNQTDIVRFAIRKKIISA